MLPYHAIWALGMCSAVFLDGVAGCEMGNVTQTMVHQYNGTLTPQAMAFDARVQSVYIADSDGSLLIVSSDHIWQRLRGASSRLQAVVGFVSTVGAHDETDCTLFLTERDSHCVKSVTVNSSMLTFEVRPYIGSCSQAGDIDGTMATTTFTSPTHLALTASGNMLYVIDLDGIRAVSMTKNITITILRLSESTMPPGMCLSANEKFLFVPRSDKNEIMRVNIAMRTYSTFRAVGMDNFVTVAMSLVTRIPDAACSVYVIFNNESLGLALVSGGNDQAKMVWRLQAQIMAVTTGNGSAIVLTGNSSTVSVHVVAADLFIRPNGTLSQALSPTPYYRRSNDSGGTRAMIPAVTTVSPDPIYTVTMQSPAGSGTLHSLSLNDGSAQTTSLKKSASPLDSAAPSSSLDFNTTVSVHATTDTLPSVGAAEGDTASGYGSLDVVFAVELIGSVACVLTVTAVVALVARKLRRVSRNRCGGYKRDVTEVYLNLVMASENPDCTPLA